MDTLELTLKLSPKDPWSDILIAELADLGFDGFVQTINGIQAYAPATVNVDEVLEQTSAHGNDLVKIERSEKIIPHQNWNEQWESNFEPVEVEEYATILAPFHDRTTAKGMIVEIQPQMSFGTGHHQTTWMMTKALFELERVAENVLDMGTGTGVLAIVAEKLGAESICAIDIENWAVENTKENAKRNQCEKISCIYGDVDAIPNEKFGLILANINKNVLRAQVERYTEVLESGGTLLLSGFFQSDVEEVVTFTEAFGLTKERVLTRDEWAAVQFRNTTTN